MGMPHPERAVLIYWGISLLLSVLFLRDWIAAWNVGATFSQPSLIVYLAVTFVLSQVLYVLVARHDSRSILPLSTLIFALGNGVIETLSFALVYRLGELIGSGLVALFAPAAASVAGYILGLIFFSIYGGLIHGLFWMKVLPPHFDDSPRSVTIRKLRPIAEVALVVGWSLCFWLYRDIWTIVAFHILVDLGLMLRVRPVLFYRRALLRA
jgi:hypothetical protein